MRESRALRLLIALATVAAVPAVTQAQWMDYKTPGVPRLADGAPDMKATAPRTADGKPDFSGMWFANVPSKDYCKTADCIQEERMAREQINMGIKLEGRPALYRVVQGADEGAAGQRRQGRSAHLLQAAELPARLDPAAVHQDRADAEGDGDPARVQCGLPRDLHGRPAAARGPESRPGTATRSPTGTGTRWSSRPTAFATTCGSTSRAAPSPRRRA